MPSVQTSSARKQPFENHLAGVVGRDEMADHAPNAGARSSTHAHEMLHTALFVLIILVASGCYAVHLLANRPHML
jgi:hypothetical protein